MSGAMSRAAVDISDSRYVDCIDCYPHPSSRLRFWVGGRSFFSADRAPVRRQNHARVVHTQRGPLEAQMTPITHATADKPTRLRTMAPTTMAVADGWVIGGGGADYLDTGGSWMM